jgi:hypothetical protein
LAWSDEEFRARVIARAAELGENLNMLLDRAGAREAFQKKPATGRRIDTLEKIAEACKWTLAEAMGFSGPTNCDWLERAYAGAERVIAALPAWARTRRLLIEAQAYLYDEMRDHLQNGDPVDDKYLRACERTLIRAWAPKGPDPALENTSTPKLSRSRKAPI